MTRKSSSTPRTDATANIDRRQPGNNPESHELTGQVLVTAFEEMRTQEIQRFSPRPRFLHRDLRVLIRTFSGRMGAEVCEGVLAVVQNPQDVNATHLLHSHVKQNDVGTILAQGKQSRKGLAGC